MQKLSPLPVKTVSIGFEDEAYTEASNARKIANYLGSVHHEFFVTDKNRLDLVTRLPEVYDEPFADPSQLPTLLLAQLTQEHVTVALSGDGGDELCAGYVRHFEAEKINSLYRYPRFMKSTIGSFLSLISVENWNLLAAKVAKFYDHSVRLPGDKLHKRARLLLASGEEDIYNCITMSHDISGICKKTFPVRMPSIELPRDDMDLGESFLYRDMLCYLPDDILTKVDRASMACGLETRVPLLDHRLVEFSWRIPFSFKVKLGNSKWLLRSVLEDFVPRSLWDRPKMGFSVPIGSWLKGPLKKWAEQYIFETSFYKSHGLLDKQSVENLWNQHLLGVGNHQYQLWNVVMFHAWYQRWLAN